MTHFVCSGGCLTVQLQRGMCPVPTCVRYRNPLSFCDCTDGTHGDWLFRNHPDPEKAKAAAKVKLAKLPSEFQKLMAPKVDAPPEPQIEPKPEPKPTAETKDVPDQTSKIAKLTKIVNRKS